MLRKVEDQSSVQHINSITFTLNEPAAKPKAGYKTVYCLMFNVGPNRMCYIGSTSDLSQRLTLHSSQGYWQNKANENNLLYKTFIELCKMPYARPIVEVRILFTGLAKSAQRVEAVAIKQASFWLGSNLLNQRMNPTTTLVAAKTSPTVKRPKTAGKMQVLAFNIKTGGKTSWPSLRAAAKGLGLEATNISRFLRGKGCSRVGNYTFTLIKKI